MTGPFEDRSMVPAMPGGVRLMLLLTLLLGVIGAGLELVLLEHTADLWQLSPLVLLSASVALLAWHAAAPRAFVMRAFQATMVLCVLSGIVGVWLHYRGNVEFEREMYPSLEGLDLFWGAMTGATPSLAPGTMCLLGFMGLIYTYRHPSLRTPRTPTVV